MRLKRNFDQMRLASPTLQPHLLVNKSHEVLHSVQNSLNFELNMQHQAIETAGQPRRLSTTEANKAAVRYWADEGFNKNNMAIADEVYATDVYYHEPAAGEVTGLETLKEFVKSWRAAFPDSQLTIEEQVAEGDHVGTRWTFRGTHLGEFRGIEPTGKPVQMSAMYFYRFANQKVVEIHAIVDTLTLLRQIEAKP